MDISPVVPSRQEVVWVSNVLAARKEYRLAGLDSPGAIYSRGVLF